MAQPRSIPTDMPREEGTTPSVKTQAEPQVISSGPSLWEAIMKSQAFEPESESAYLLRCRLEKNAPALYDEGPTPLAGSTSVGSTVAEEKKSGTSSGMGLLAAGAAANRVEDGRVFARKTNPKKS